MNCPKCSAAMERVVFEAIEIDRCTACRGIVFDSMEAERLKKLRGSESIDVGDAAVGKKHDTIDRIRIWDGVQMTAR